MSSDPFTIIIIFPIIFIIIRVVIMVDVIWSLCCFIFFPMTSIHQIQFNVIIMISCLGGSFVSFNYHWWTYQARAHCQEEYHEDEDDDEQIHLLYWPTPLWISNYEFYILQWTETSLEFSFLPSRISNHQFLSLSTENQTSWASCDVSKYVIFSGGRTNIDSAIDTNFDLANLTSATFLMSPMQIEWSSENHSGLFKTQCLNFKLSWYKSKNMTIFEKHWYRLGWHTTDSLGWRWRWSIVNCFK